MDSANGGPCVLIGSGGHGAGIEHHDFRFFSTIGGGKALCRKLALQSGSISLRGAASKIVDEKSWHNKHYN